MSWQAAAPLPAAPIGDPDPTDAASPAPSPATSSSRIPAVPAVAGESLFSGDELQALLRLRQRYEQGDADVCDDEFSAEERARLGFVRWLYQSGRVAS